MNTSFLSNLADSSKQKENIRGFLYDSIFSLHSIVNHEKKPLHNIRQDSLWFEICEICVVPTAQELELYFNDTVASSVTNQKK